MTINDDLGMTEEERAETTARIDAWFGIDPATGGVDPAQASAEAADTTTPVAGVPVIPGAPVPPPPALPEEFQLGDIFVSAADAPVVGQLYTFLRNNPHRANELKALMESPPPPPQWQQQNVGVPPASPPVGAPTYLPPPNGWVPPVQPPPQQSWTPVPAVNQPPVDLDDPGQKYLYDRLQYIEHQASLQNQAMTTWQQQEQQRQAQAQAEQSRIAQTTLIEQNIAAGVARFRALHPDLSEDDFGYATTEASRLNIVSAIAQTMPYDQAVAKALELAYATRPGGGSTQGNPSGKNPADAKRQASLSALSGWSKPGPRVESTPNTPAQPRRGDGGPVLTDQDRAAAMKMIEQAGIGSLGNALS